MGKVSGDAQAEVERLKRELTDTREYLQSVIEQQELAIQELRERNAELRRLLPIAPTGEESTV